MHIIDTQNNLKISGAMTKHVIPQTEIFPACSPWLASQLLESDFHKTCTCCSHQDATPECQSQIFSQQSRCTQHSRYAPTDVLERFQGIHT